MSNGTKVVQAPVRPLRGLILEVIDEMMSKPPMYQEPAEVLGGSELAPLFAAPKARPKAAPVDEDCWVCRPLAFAFDAFLPL
eukprot:g30285.t1